MKNLKFKKQVFKGLMSDLIDNKDNLHQGSDQSANWLVNNFRRYNGNAFVVNDRDIMVDFVYSCVYYNNLMYAVIDKDYNAAEFNILQLVDVFNLPIGSIDEYLDQLFTAEDKANRESRIPGTDIDFKTLGDDMILMSESGISMDDIKNIAKDISDHE